jgi:hypothetical protein
MLRTGDVISYLDLCNEERSSLQRGMNFCLHGEYSVILMSRRADAPYIDKIENNGRTLIYEGHDISKSNTSQIPKLVDQPMRSPSGRITQNGRFFDAAQRYKSGEIEAERVKVYEKLRSGIWVFNGIFHLVDAWREKSQDRIVFKFKLELMDNLLNDSISIQNHTIEHDRLIPSEVKVAVWKRDNGRCVLCGSTDNLHFDHIIPYSKGGSSLVAANIQLLCARHNLLKRDNIE